MKKAAGITIKVLAGLIIIILIAMFTIPVIFKEKIRAKVETVINESVNARVTFGGYNLSFFRNFPNLSFSLNDIYVSGTGPFEGDTLAGFRSLSLVFNLGSLLGSSGYEIKSIILDRAVINGIVLKDGTPNWDIMKPSSDTLAAAGEITETLPEEGAGESTMKVLLRKFEIRQSVVTYNDASLNMSAVLKNINYSLSGNMTLSETDLKMALTIDETTVGMDGINYLNKAKINSEISLLANLDSMKFTFAENFFSVNELKLNFNGTVAMPGDNIVTDLNFGTEQTSFKTLLSLIPAVYMSGYEGLRTSGSFTLTGSAKGTYSDADSTLPDIKLNLSVKDGVVSYPDLPEKISAININTDVFVNGSNLDLTTVNLDNFHFELAGNPFDMNFSLKTPVSDPDFRGSFRGRIDLGALSKAVPMEDMKLSGIIEMEINMAGRLSMIEKEQYESFTAKGTMGIKNMLVAMTGYPEVLIRDASFLFTPAFTSMEKLDILVAGSSDFLLRGNVGNYIPYVFRSETLKGVLTLNSSKVDVTSILGAMSVDTTAVVDEDTTSLAVIAVPRNIDFDFNAQIASLIYDNIKAENLRGHIIVRDGVLSLRETGMSVVGGTVKMNADYDTRDTLKPVVKADFEMNNISIKDAFNTFVTVQKFAPAARGLDGRISLQMKYESLLGSDMMPVTNSINGYGKLKSDQVQVLEAPAFDKLKEVLKLSDNYTNTFKDINISFRISDGRVFVSPFDVKMGTIKMNISGDQGLDQTLNYLVRTEIPRAALGASVNALMDNLTAQASALGIAYKPSDIIKVNVRIRGVVGKPEVSPDFGTGGEGAGSGVKETVKETVKQTVTETVGKGKEALRKEAEEQGDKLIREAEARGQQLREEADKTAIRLKEEAEAEAAKLISAAESKGTLAKAAARKAADALVKEAERKGNQLRTEADKQAVKLADEAKAKKEEMISKIN